MYGSPLPNVIPNRFYSFRLLGIKNKVGRGEGCPDVKESSYYNHIKEEILCIELEKLDI